MSEIIRLEPKAANNCFGCGGANESGMHLTFDLYGDEGKTRGKFVLGSRYGGGAGVALGGINAVLLRAAQDKSPKPAGRIARPRGLSARSRQAQTLEAGI